MSAHSYPPLEPLHDDLWVATRPLRLAIGDIGTRMSVVRLGDELLLHSPVPLDEPTRTALDAVGRVRWVVGPSRVHHLYLGDWVAAYPSAELCGAPGLAEKRRDLHFHRLLDESLESEWGGALKIHLFQGAPLINEVVFLHPASRTLIFTDLAFHVPATETRARLFLWLVGARGRFGPHRMVRAMIRDRGAAARSVEALLEWDFDRVIVTHGEVLESGGRDAVAAAFAYLSS